MPSIVGRKQATRHNHRLSDGFGLRLIALDAGPEAAWCGIAEIERGEGTLAAWGRAEEKGRKEPGRAGNSGRAEMPRQGRGPSGEQRKCQNERDLGEPRDRKGRGVNGSGYSWRIWRLQLRGADLGTRAAFRTEPGQFCLDRKEGGEEAQEHPEYCQLPARGRVPTMHILSLPPTV